MPMSFLNGFHQVEMFPYLFMPVRKVFLSIFNRSKSCFIGFYQLEKFSYRFLSGLLVCFFVCAFAPSSVLLTNRLTQALKIRIDCRVNFSWSSEHRPIFLTSYVLSFKSYEFF